MSWGTFLKIIICKESSSKKTLRFLPPVVLQIVIHSPLVSAVSVKLLWEAVARLDFDYSSFPLSVVSLSVVQLLTVKGDSKVSHRKFQK